jgi:hypothetical protein
VARERTNKQFNSHEVPEPRIEPTTHWDHIGDRRAYYRNATDATQAKQNNFKTKPFQLSKQLVEKNPFTDLQS